MKPSQEGTYMSMFWTKYYILARTSQTSKTGTHVSVLWTKSSSRLAVVACLASTSAPAAVLPAWGVGQVHLNLKLLLLSPSTLLGSSMILGTIPPETLSQKTSYT